MVAHMKTTVDLPDALFRELKEVASSQQVNMRELIIEGLRNELDRRRSPQPRVDFAFRTVDGSGLQAGVAAEDAIRISYGLPS